MSSNRISSHLERSALGSAVKNLSKQYYSLQSVNEHLRNEETQTDFRDNECQTTPWESRFKVVQGHPEVLAVANFINASELPIGVREVDMINRMRIKRAWEKILPPMDTPANIKTRSALLNELEADAWSYRDAEIQLLMNLRMRLAEKMMKANDYYKKIKTNNRFAKVNERLSRRKQQELQSIKRKFLREFRKLAQKHQAIKLCYSKRVIVKRSASSHPTFNSYGSKSDGYNSEILAGNSTDSCIETESVTALREKQYARWLFSRGTQRYRNLTKSQMLREPQVPCRRKVKLDEKKWLESCSQADKTYSSSKMLSTTSSLLERKEKMPTLPVTPCREQPDDPEAMAKQSAYLIQKLVKGRAEQFVIIEEKNRYKELIDELQADESIDTQDFGEMCQSQSDAAANSALLKNRFNEILEALEGQTVAKVLIFLTNELKRLQDEKNAHALALLAERRRLDEVVSENAEQQRELNRCRELDEVFRQISKINQESVQSYLEEVLGEGVDYEAGQQAERGIFQMMDEAELMEDVEPSTEKADEEGMISDMMYNFVLPYVEKQSATNRSQTKKQRELCAARQTLTISMRQLDVENVNENKLACCTEINSRASSRASNPEQSIDNCCKFANDVENNVNNDEHALDHIVAIISGYAQLNEEDLELKNVLLKILQTTRHKTT